MIAVKVILYKNVDKLGRIGDIVEVKPGYARNFLIPKGYAAVVDEGKIKDLEYKKKIAEKKRLKELADAEALAEKLSSVSCTVAVNVTEEGKLYGSITPRDIIEALEKEGVKLDKNMIKLDEPIKEVGVYEIPIEITSEITTKLKVWVVKK